MIMILLVSPKNEFFFFLYEAKYVRRIVYLPIFNPSRFLYFPLSKEFNRAVYCVVRRVLRMCVFVRVKMKGKFLILYKYFIELYILHLG